VNVVASDAVLRIVNGLADELRAGGIRLLRAELDDSLERDLGFDSLERAELAQRLEKAFGVRLPPHTLATAKTPRDLLWAIGGRNAAVAAEPSSERALSLPDVSRSHVDANLARAPNTLSAAAAEQREKTVGGATLHGGDLRVGIGDLLFAGYTWVLFATLGLGALALVVMLPRLAWRRHAAQAIARTFVTASGISVEVSGADNIPLGGPITVVANHASYLDALVLTKVLPTRCNFVAKRELARYFATRLLLGRIGTRFVERADAEASVVATQEIALLAKRSASFAFFAEGTFTREPGLRAFRMGAFVIAASAGTPVVPVAIRGTRLVLRDGQWLPRVNPIQIVVSAPIRPEGSDWAAAVRLRDETRAAILAGCGEPDLLGKL
jgi:1-acyl-sn-glycerol-3-phosphate acyltransferase